MPTSHTILGLKHPTGQYSARLSEENLLRSVGRDNTLISPDYPDYLLFT